MTEHVFGVDALLRRFTELVGEAEQASMRIVKRSMAVVESEVKKGFTTSHSKGTPTPSQPGDPPSVITGTLRRSVTSTKAEKVGLGDARGQVYPTAIYGRIQELGGSLWNGGFLPPRPYMAPGYERAKPQIARIAFEEWRAIGL